MQHIAIPLAIVCALIILDYITGVVNAIVHKQLSSEAMRTGLAHKFAYLVVLALALIIEYSPAWLEMDIALPVFIPACVGIALIEITSILENCVKINPSLANSKVLDIFKTAAQALSGDKGGDNA